MTSPGMEDRVCSVQVYHLITHFCHLCKSTCSSGTSGGRGPRFVKPPEPQVSTPSHWCYREFRRLRDGGRRRQCHTSIHRIQIKMDIWFRRLTLAANNKNISAIFGTKTTLYRIEKKIAATFIFLGKCQKFRSYYNFSLSSIENRTVIYLC